MVLFKKVKIPVSWDDIQPNFPSFSNLHLEMLEDRKKIKKGAQLIPLQSYKGNAMTKYNPPSTLAPAPDSSSKLEFVKSPSSKPPPSPPPSPIRTYASPAHSPSPSPAPSRENSDDELLDVLGTQSSHSRNKRDEEDKEENKEENKEEENKKEENEKKEEESEKNEEEKEEENEENVIEKERKEYIRKINKIQKTYSDVDVPPFGEHSTHHELKEIYEDLMFKINSKQNTIWYKGILTALFVLIEYIATQLVGLNFTDYSSTMISTMTVYDNLLEELGEKSYLGFSTSLPVELRLLFTIILYTVIFYVGKLICNRGGDAISGLFKSFVASMGFKMPTSTSTPFASAATPNKRKGPKTTAEDIKNMSD